MDDAAVQLARIARQLTQSNRPRLLFILPASAGDILLATSLLESLKELYPAHDLYFSCKPEFFSILRGNPFITCAIPYEPVMEQQTLLEGMGEWPGLFDIAIMASVMTQRHINYLNNGHSRIAFNLRRANALA